MEIEISIIIPSYNRYPQNLLTLYSLENQTFDSSKMEVILIDDGSTDETPEIPKQFKPSFLFKYIRNEENYGRSRARNVGIERSLGKTIIFLDAEMIVDPDFVQNHYNYQQNNTNLVLSGGPYHKRVYSCFYPEFTKEQHHQIKSLLKNIIKAKIPLSEKVLSLKNGNLVQLLSKQDILSKKYQLLAFESPYLSEIFKQYGDKLNGYNLPWVLFLSGFVSIPRNLLQKVGGFDEGFKGWGFEDWELGYRLYQAGATFRCDSNVSGYHQEHPVSYDELYRDLYKNYLRYQRKHQSFEVCIHVLFLMNKINRIQENLVVGDYKLLCQSFPDSFQHFKNGFLTVLKELAVLMADQKPINRLLNRLDIEDPIKWKHLLLSERNKIKSLNQYPHLIQVFDNISILL
ncbi:glycosyltransferase family 2 protein [Metabacillus elymi]|uniref:Glycosyltransferase n=1 Tax=Metabacillus elymi TaxID=2745198 RepID=A0ABX6S3A9_9BACI|nr:glycosyltransferase [Metabacillus sp. KUDC1714]QNF28489.1 glycosyltransferase [Metabacillus sp. KUDC1714]